MGRVRENINVNGRDSWTLFDTGARNTYVTPEVAAVLQTVKAHKPYRTALGGSVKVAHETTVLEADIEGRAVSTHAMVIDSIGKDEDGRDIEILFGAIAMQQWGIRPIPDEEKLDLSHYPDEFIEF